MQVDLVVGFVLFDGYLYLFVDILVFMLLLCCELGVVLDMINCNYVNVLSSDLIVVLLGGYGMVEEIVFVQCWCKLFVCFGLDGVFWLFVVDVVCMLLFDDVIWFVGDVFVVEWGQVLWQVRVGVIVLRLMKVDLGCMYVIKVLMMLVVDVVVMVEMIYYVL